MEQQTTLGTNRTGIAMSPVDAARMEEGAEAMAVETDGPGYLEVRQEYASDEGLGSVPLPTTVKGVLKSGAEILTGKRPQVFVDKLGERLAFERAGVRLYDALLVKCDAAPGLISADATDELQHFRDEEAEHFSLVAEAMKAIGADPTAQTPCADLAGVEGMGLMQAMNDPRTSVAQSLHVMLDAELLDNAAWEMLIDLARSLGHDEIAERFDHALQQEGKHLQRLKGLVGELTLADAQSQEGEPLPLESH